MRTEERRMDFCCVRGTYASYTLLRLSHARHEKYAVQN